MNAKKALSLAICCCFLWIILIPTAVFAKGHSSGGFKGGGRSAFSTKATSPNSSKSDFSTPRPSTPDALAKDYHTDGHSYSSETKSFSTSRPSYTGTWNRSEAKELDRYPSKPPVNIFGSPPGSAYEYHNYYWEQPWLYHLFFHPTYHYTSWGYGYYEPAFFTWLITFLIIGLVGYFIYRKLKTNREDS